MATYIYTFPEELWFNSGGSSTLIKNGNFIKPKDIEYLLRTHPDRVVCIERDIVERKEYKETGLLDDLKFLVRDQGYQIKDLIETIKSSNSQQVVYVQSMDGIESLTNKVEKIDIEEPEFQPYLKHIDTENITVTGKLAKSSTESSSDLQEKLNKLKKFKERKEGS